MIKKYKRNLSAEAISKMKAGGRRGSIEDKREAGRRGYAKMIEVKVKEALEQLKA